MSEDIVTTLALNSISSVCSPLGPLSNRFELCVSLLKVHNVIDLPCTKQVVPFIGLKVNNFYSSAVQANE